MPAGGVEARARATSTVAVLRHRQMIAPELGELLDAAESGPLDAHQAAVVRLVRHDRDRSLRLPDELVRRIGMAATRGNAVWEEARTQRDFALFQPHLEEMVALKREQADLLGHDGERYDALLEGYEPGMRTAQVEPMFAALTGDLSELLDQILAAEPLPAPPFAGRTFPDEARCDSACGCCRIWDTTWRRGGWIFPLTRSRTRSPRASPDHDPDVRRRPVPLGDGHDPRGRARPVRAGHGSGLRGPAVARRRRWACTSRSRGCGRTWWGAAAGFWQHYTPVICESSGRRWPAPPPRTSTATSTPCSASLIRVDADEVTYNLHVLIRFELSWR